MIVFIPTLSSLRFQFKLTDGFKAAIHIILHLGQELLSVMPFSDGIQTNEQYNEAIELMDRLVDDAEKNDLFIGYLFPIIKDYKNTTQSSKR